MLPVEEEREIEGKPVNAAVDFLTHCSPPNTGRLSIRHTPPELGHRHHDPNIGLLQEDEPRQHVTHFATLLGLLSTLQKASSTVITVPNFADVPPEQIRDWRFAAALLQGREATGTYPDGHGVIVELPAGTEVPDGDVIVAMPLTVLVGN